MVRMVMELCPDTLTIDLKSLESARSFCVVAWKFRRSFEMLLISALNSYRTLDGSFR